MAVVKADAYGHGAPQVARAAVAAGAAELGVATIDEALALRRGGITAPVLSWLHPPGTDFAPALTAGVQIAVSSVRQVGDLLEAVERTGRTAEVTVKVDTGLNRNGVSPADYPAVLTALQRGAAADAIRIRGIMSHLANRRRAGRSLNDLQANGSRPDRRGPQSRHRVRGGAPVQLPVGDDTARPGLRHGAARHRRLRSQSDSRAGRHGLRPAMTLKCTVAMVKPVKAGEGVSYGHTWIAEEDTNLALLPIGYADGVYRTLSGRIDALINGRLRRNVGRICMDQLVVNLGPGAPDVAEGDEAILFGPGTSGEPPPRTGPIWSAPSTTRSSPARVAGSCGPTGRSTPVAGDPEKTSKSKRAKGIDEQLARSAEKTAERLARKADNPASGSARGPGCWPVSPG